MITVLTTLPHFLALIYTYKNVEYSLTLVTSTVLSIVWHIQGEPQSILMITDYVFALLVVAMEVIYNPRQYDFIITITFLVWVLNMMADNTSNYELYHSLWHLVSSVKTIYVGYMYWESINEIPENTYIYGHSEN